MTHSFISYAKLNSLEEFSFIAGNTYTLEFEVYDEDDAPSDLGGATIVWTLCPYGQPDYTILQKSGAIDVSMPSKFTVELDSADTDALSGKFIQQPVITAFGGQEYRPAQGVVLILPRIPTI